MQIPLLPVIAAGFASAGMLFWLAAASIPIAIHLLTRRQKERQQWAAMQLLMEVIEKESKRVRIEQLILLAIRVLILVLLAFALARPFLGSQSQGDEGANASSATLWIVAIDTSYSMDYLPEEGKVSQFERAKEYLEDVIHAAKTGDAFWIVELAQPCRLVNQLPTFSKENALSAVAKLQQLHTGANLLEGLQLVEDLANQAEEIEGLPACTHVLILSDLGEDSWQPVLQEATGREQLDRLAAQTKFQVVPFNSDASRNVAVEELRVNKNTVTVSESLEVDLTVTNIDQNAEADLKLELLLDDRLVEEKVGVLSAGEKAAYHFSIEPGEVGEHIVAARVGPDSLMPDNERRQVVIVRESTRVLVVAEQQSEAELYRTCLLPPGLEDASNLELDAVRPTELALRSLAEFDVVLINDCEALSNGSVDRLVRFAENGGGLVFVLGARVNSEWWNKKAATSFAVSLKSIEGDGVLSIDPLGYKSSFAEPFLGFPDAGLITTPIFRYWDVQLKDGFTVDLALSDGAAFLASRAIGAGQIAVLTSAPESGAEANKESWNAIAAWPSFVPLLDQIVQVVSQPEDNAKNILVGKTLSGTISATENTDLRMEKPDGSQQVVSFSNAEKSVKQEWAFRQTLHQGVYRLNKGQQEAGVFVANVNPQESALTSVKLPAKFTRVPESKTTIPADSEASLSINDSFSRFLLVLLLVLVVSESLVARWIGRRAA